LAAGLAAAPGGGSCGFGAAARGGFARSAAGSAVAPLFSRQRHLSFRFTPVLRVRQRRSARQQRGAASSAREKT
jgi:hypothetical protein